MGKLPAFQFYPGDWLKESALRMAAASTRGLWIDFLCHAWNAVERGVMEASEERFCRLFSCTTTDLDQFITDNEELHFCDLSRSVTPDGTPMLRVVNRRQVREEKERQQATIRQRRHRSNDEHGKGHAASHGNVTSPSSSSSSSGSFSLSGSDPDLNDQEKKIDRRSSNAERFEEFWNLYPRKDGKKPAKEVWTKLSAEDRSAAIEDVPKRLSANWQGQIICHAKTYLNQRRWEDELQNSSLFNGAPVQHRGNGPPPLESNEFWAGNSGMSNLVRRAGIKPGGGSESTGNGKVIDLSESKLDPTADRRHDDSAVGPDTRRRSNTG